MTTPDVSRLATYVERRRHELGLARLAAAQSVGLSKDTWHRVESGRPVRTSTFAAIERGLGWALGSCQEILDGGEPTVVERSPHLTDIAMTRGSDLGEAIRQASVDAIIATTDLPASQIRAINNRLLQELQNRGIISVEPDEPTKD